MAGFRGERSDLTYQMINLLFEFFLTIIKSYLKWKFLSENKTVK